MKFAQTILLVFSLLNLNAALAFFNSTDIELSFNYNLTTPLLHPPYVSGVVGDVTDPAANLGFCINVTNDKVPIKASEYNAFAEVDKSFLSKENIKIIKKDGLLWVKIIPAKPGIITFRIVVESNGENEFLEVDYAASLSKKSGGYWQTGISDASAAMDIGNGFMLVADDEMNTLNVYNYRQSGLPLKSFNYSEKISLDDKKNGVYREIDCEALAVSPKDKNKVYWIGSMSNGGNDFEQKDNRSSLFATTIKGVGDGIDVAYSSNYKDLRKEVIKWGNANGYKLSSSSKDGHSPKTIDGFNLEGACFAPNGTTFYLCFRAPLVPVNDRTKALIIPILNFEEWFNKGKPKSAPTFAKPIELNLGGRGFRDVFVLPNKKYIVVAGGYDGSLVTSLFLWSGNSDDKPIQIIMPDLTEMPIECGFPILQNNVFQNEIVLITDSGSKDYYDTGNASKNLHPYFRKFNTVVIKLPMAAESR